ncbi:toll/interleukin-1 receptor domain-containing protein [Aminipila sp.]|uniref:toll/interleukin-1 receptor domain-containing protein n=1 Tax=Aminipila sp. TaxID=2060095 RepID=UPI0028A1C52C|nr:toll/interleukin-1 receptor domain-containing protein [Aminipila sp.]
MVNLFISYCQKDGIYADDIELYFKDKDIVLHRDIRDISSWKSIREYMQSIRDMDYAVLIITDNYLKSFNCMYEVLEVMKERNYQDKIFPVVVEKKIFNTSGRIQYITYWQEEFKKLKEEMLKIKDVINAGSIIDDLKRTQNITLNIDEFLGKVSDMNNPNISDISVSIKNKLIEQGILKEEQAKKSIEKGDDDIFSKLDIPKMVLNSQPTDLEKNKFMANNFSRINCILGKLCKQLEKENQNFQVEIEEIDSRTTTYEFYKSGSQVRALKLSLGNSFGGRENNIGISCERYSMGNNNSFNGIFSVKVEDGQLVLYSMFSMSGQKTMSTDDVAKEIWISFIQPYI